MNGRDRPLQDAMVNEVLDPWLQSLSAVHVRAVFVLGPDFSTADNSREVVSVLPESYRTAALAMARSGAYGAPWRKAKSPLVAWKNFGGQQPDDERLWVDHCLESGALSLVRVDFPTSLDHGFECVILLSSELADPGQVHSIAYSAQAIWPLLKEHVIAHRFGVSLREQEVLVMLAEGHTAKEAGTLLGLAERTVTFHISNVMGKLRARNQRSLILRACSVGLV
ncbi:MAG: LuxR C-terminal-related transcriptional regulator [Pseudomonadota bacterium]